MRAATPSALGRTVVLLLFAALLGAAAGCSPVPGQPATPSSPDGHTSPSSASTSASVEGTAIAGAAEIRFLLSRFSQPEEAGDLGYEMLGPDHNDTAAWIRGVVLAHAEYGSLVRSLAAQQSGIPSAALTYFDRSLASKGATATYDAIVGAEWRLQDGSTKQDEALATLVPASTFMGLLFDRQGSLADAYRMKAIAASGSVATVTYAKSGAPDVSLEFELAREPGGDLRIVGVRNYSQIKRALSDTEFGDGLP